MKSLDQFYTKPKIAKKCYEKLKKYININDFDFILEPSAGTGSFFDLLDENKRIGLDIDPKHEKIIQMDYFDYKPDLNLKYLVIGNPPFGRVCSLSIDFFNRSAEFADIIAFIIPRTFKRVSVQNRLNLNFHLVYSKDLPLKPCCFEPKMSAKCCFQIWQKSKNQRKKVVYDRSHSDFNFIKLGPKDKNNQPTPPKTADFVIKAYGSNCGEVVDKNLSTLRPKSWHWIKSNISVFDLKQRFRELDYSMSKDTVRQDSIGQQELILLYKNRFG